MANDRIGGSKKPTGDRQAQATATPANASKEASANGSNLPRLTILVVDDDEHFLEYVTIPLREHFDVLTATDGESALQLFKDKHPSLVITDICMPKMSGFELIRALAQLPSTPLIIAISGYDITQTNYEAVSVIEQRVTRIIRKPCTAQEVCNVAEELLAQGAASRRSSFAV